MVKVHFTLAEEKNGFKIDSGLNKVNYLKINLLNKSCVCVSAIDLCAEGKHDCEQICVSSPGSFTCDCNKGYKLNDDKKTCSS